MSNNIVNLNDYRPHQESYVACLDCGKDWVAVAPADVLHFECPKCNTLSGVKVNPSDQDFMNAFMHPAKRKANITQRTMVVINAMHLMQKGLI
tara:strand:- start:203 stop:481 length:279 start_codon:yes stop_codon:yes gene_type:complete